MPDTHFYRYDDYDRALVGERVAQFRDQVRRRLAGELTEDQFKPLRLRTASTCSSTPTCCASPSRTAR